MALEQSQYRLQARKNEDILPSHEQLAAFLDSPKRAGRKETHRDDLKYYLEFYAAVQEFALLRKRGNRTMPYQDALQYGVLDRSGLFTPGVRSAVEHFKYYRQALSEIDLKKPSVFIRSAEEEIARLRAGKKDEAARIDRLQRMIDERKRDMDAQRKRWSALQTELNAILAAVGVELEAIRKHCEASIGALVDLQVGKKAENRMIEYIKNHFKDQVRDSLQHGPVTKEFLESMKATVARLSKQISLQLLEDLFVMTGLYESVHDYAAASLKQLAPLLGQLAVRPQTDLEADRDFFSGVEQSLVAVLAGFRIEIRSPAAIPKDPEHEGILMDTRWDMLDRLFPGKTSGS